MSHGNKRVVITGVGIVSPIGTGKQKYLENILKGSSGVDRLSCFDASAYTAQIAAEVKDFNADEFIEKKKQRRMDRFSQFAVAAAKMAVEDSGIDFSKEVSERCGVIIGSGIGGLHTIENEYNEMISKGPRKISPFLIPMLINNIAPAEVAIIYGVTGPNYAVSSACATSNHAIGDALRMIRYGDADVIITGGTEAAITPLGYGGFCSIKALSTRNDDPKRASRPFDKMRDGFIMGEGAGIIVLETLEHAKKRGARIYGELAGYGATDDAYHITAPSPDFRAASRAMQCAINDAGMNNDDIDYINAHGTSTELNDKIETAAIKNTFGERAKKIPVSSTKSMVGHLLGAAGGAELIASLLCMEKNLVHQTINYEVPDPECDLDYVPNKPRELKIRSFLSNSLGFGGHNAVLVVKRYDE